MNMTNTILFCAALAAIAGSGYASEGSDKPSTPLAATRLELFGSHYQAKPEKAKLLCESGKLALFAGETAEDSAYNKAREPKSLDPCRNSLFLRHRRANGTDEWRLVLTTGCDWREADGMSKWESCQVSGLKGCFEIRKAGFSSDGRHLWLVCDSHTYTYSVVCSYDVCNHTFRVLIDGDTADEQSDGTILVKNKKFYPNDDLGAAWHDVWITPDGTIVRKGPITLRGADL